MIDVLLGSWAAGETKTFHVNGSYFEILECAYPIDVKLLDRSGAVRSDMRQAEASFYSQGLEFATIQITSINAQKIRSFYGDGTAGTRRTAGVVSVIDGGKSRTMAGDAFMMMGGMGAVAGQYSRGQLWNPTLNKRIVIKSYKAASQAAGQIKIMESPLQNATTAVFALSKLVGGVNSSAVFRGDSVVVLNTSLAMDAFFTTGSESKEKILSEPIVLNPGTGIDMECGTVNTQANFGFEWFEELIT